MSLLLKGQILFALCSCNILYTVLRTEAVRSESLPAEDIIIFSEFFKLIFCIGMIFTSGEESSAQGKYANRLFWLLRHSSKLAFVALTYFIMDLFSFLNFDYIGAGEFSVFAQAKVLFTALFSVLLLNMKISAGRWRALILLCIGCILVASPAYNVCDRNEHQDNKKVEVNFHLKVVGYSMVLLQSMLSGVANIYFEKVVKSKSEVITIWERNFQLSFWSMVFCLFSKFYREGFIELNFSHWGLFSISSMVLGVTNGLLIALTLKHCDSVIKTVAQSSSIVFCTIIGSLYQNEVVDSFVSMGCIVTIIAVSNYTFDVPPPDVSPKTKDVVKATISAAAVRAISPKKEKGEKKKTK